MPINIMGSSNLIIRKKAIEKEEKRCESIVNRKK
jgi:hypothetical protein